MENLNITMIQADIAWKDKKKNLRKFTNLIEKVKNTDIIVLPEMFNTGFAVNDQLCAEDTKGETYEWMKNMAALKNSIVTGSIYTKDNGAYYNRLIWMNPEGESIEYDKRHLFRLTGEDKKINPGKKKIIAHVKGWKILPLICYDLRFPVWSKNTFDNDEYEYDCLIYIANWPGRRNFSWKSLLVARAIENQSYVVGVNRIGADGNNIPHHGDSMVLNYRGREVSKTLPDEESVETTLLNYDELKDFRESFKVGLDWDKFTVLY